MMIDVLLHFGTLIALLAYFWREWLDMIKAQFKPQVVPESADGGTKGQKLLLWLIVLACIPGALAGLSLEDIADTTFRKSPILIAASLIGMGILLLIADRIGRKTRTIESIRPVDWMVIGIAQAFAIIPGFSRSGVTITAGLFCGLQREAAARFSFLLGTPIILGAALFESRHLFTERITQAEIFPLLLGMLASAVVGYLCIGFLLGFLKKRSNAVFVVYRILLGTAIIASYSLGYLRG